MPTYAQAVANVLAERGVRYVFGLPGGEIVAFINACREAGLQFLLTGHEASTAWMAQVVGQMTGTPGVCAATLGPGATNLVTGGNSLAELTQDPIVTTQEWASSQCIRLASDDDGSGGPDAAGVCHFLYFPPPDNIVYDLNADQSSIVGWFEYPPFGTDLVTSSCIIHAGSPGSYIQMNPKVVDLGLDIEFPASSTRANKKHMYVQTRNRNGLSSFGGAFRYWGWWSTP
jgi:hypothetical protein